MKLPRLNRPVATRRNDLPLPDSALGSFRQLLRRIWVLLHRDTMPVSNPIEALLAPPPRRERPQAHDIESGSLVHPSTPFSVTTRGQPGTAAKGATEAKVAPARPSTPAAPVNPPATVTPAAPVTLSASATPAPPDPRDAQIAALTRELGQLRAAFAQRERELLAAHGELRLERERLQLIADAATRKTAEALRELEDTRAIGLAREEARRGRRSDA